MFYGCIKTPSCNNNQCLSIYMSFMIPGNIIIMKHYEGTPLSHINKHRIQFKIHNTHFLHSYHPNYTQVHSRL